MPSEVLSLEKGIAACWRTRDLRCCGCTDSSSQHQHVQKGSFTSSEP